MCRFLVSKIPCPSAAPSSRFLLYPYYREGVRTADIVARNGAVHILDRFLSPFKHMHVKAADWQPPIDSKMGDE